MDTVECKLKNCYGIDDFYHKFDFHNTNVIAIYARNGLMKTSFAKTFKKIQDGESDQICDEIFNLDGEVKIKVDDKEIEKDQVFVIKSFENYYESDSVSNLLVDKKTKKTISELLKLKNAFLKRLEKLSGLKIQRTTQGKKVYEIEPTIISDMQCKENSLLLSLKKLEKYENNIDFQNVKYSTIFDPTVIKKIKDNSFQNKIEDFCNASEEIYKDYDFFEMGKFTFPKLKNVAKNLSSDKFFVKNNKILLNNKISIESDEDLQNKISEIEDKIKDVPEFKQIEKLLSDSKGILLRDAIENNPELVEFLKLKNLDSLKQELWTSYINKERKIFDELVKTYSKLEKDIISLSIDDTLWKQSLKIFEDRFTVPYKMNIANLRGAIIGENLPRVEFVFEKDGDQVSLNRSSLEKLDILSQGEKRSLYLLNIIFDIEKLKMENKEVLFIIDDIADSFDYKNKYAIVEYLCEMADIENFKMIILSHNFDFYRTVSSRLNVPRSSRFIIEDKKNLLMVEEKYQRQPFKTWKNKPDIYSTFALIPFVRNLIEFSIDKSAGGLEPFEYDYDLLTNLLHRKEASSIINFEVLCKVYKEYLGEFNLPSDFKDSDIVLEKLIETADKITYDLNQLEHKILLSIACRLKAEELMLKKIDQYEGFFTWKVKKKLVTGNKKEFLEHVNSNNNMTRVLFDGYKQISSKENIMILNEVNIMTPENIHINSFMYEPILDMDINELLNLYTKIKELFKYVDKE